MTVNGRKFSSYREAALEFGLLESDTYIEDNLEEATAFQMPLSLHFLFAVMLVYCLPSNPKNLWKKFQLEFSRDYQNIERYNEFDSLEIAHKVLDDINRALQQMGKNLNDYWLMPEDSALTIISIQPKNVQPTSEELLMPSMLNDQQRLAYDSILKKALCNYTWQLDGLHGLMLGFHLNGLYPIRPILGWINFVLGHVGLSQTHDPNMIQYIN